MGTDIHGFIERTDRGPRPLAQNISWLVTRAYTIFEALFGVAGGYEFEPSFIAHRGLPEERSMWFDQFIDEEEETIQNLEYFGATWFTVKELHEVDWDTTGENRCYIISDANDNPIVRRRAKRYNLKEVIDDEELIDRVLEGERVELPPEAVPEHSYFEDADPRYAYTEYPTRADVIAGPWEWFYGHTCHRTRRDSARRTSV
ncbi:hypothetical protein [Haloprofundus salinisoli]|uniref:hypothetical protein n=1 Tax=Haloprofundus salinisoli TaxID=2876193 RepID=UPI001CC91C24|nr:hypothetical protein [Haloprofundus salinisoli]